MGSLLSGKDDLMKKFTIYEDLYSFNLVYLTTNYEDYLDKVAQKPTAKPASITQTTKTQDSVEEEIAQNKIIHSKEQLLISNLVNRNRSCAEAFFLHVPEDETIFRPSLPRSLPGQIAQFDHEHGWFGF